ncbi:MAG: hypothetical protein A2Y14_01300 [Verrucomicrobia bacterium GWF2_51_19]|nr:MAG: hypothetical protein A2Y14_01300 [Verrucomicrobia bacterium GWF2_51_19]
MFASVLFAGAEDKNTVLHLQEDYRMLSEQLKQLQVDVETLQAKNGTLQKEVTQLKRERESFLPDSHEALDAIKTQVAALEKRYDEQKASILKSVQEQVESLSQQMQKIFDSLTKLVQPTRAVKKDFSDDYPQRGVVYTVQPGDTLSVIAQKHKSTVRDLQNANRINNPKDLMVGQNIFIPQKD